MNKIKKMILILVFKLFFIRAASLWAEVILSDTYAGYLALFWTLKFVKHELDAKLQKEQYSILEELKKVKESLLQDLDVPINSQYN